MPLDEAWPAIKYYEWVLQLHRSLCCPKIMDVEWIHNLALFDRVGLRAQP